MATEKKVKSGRVKSGGVNSPTPSLTHSPTPHVPVRPVVIDAAHCWLERTNPLVGVSIRTAQGIFDAARSGDTQRLHWLFQEIEAANPVLFTCIDRRQSAIAGFQLKVSALPSMEGELADEQKDAVESFLADIENFMQMGVDLIITSPNEATPLTDVIKRAYESGIPVILLDRKIDGDTYTQFIGADNVYIGKVCGEYVADVLLPDGGKICEIEGLAGTSGGIERDQGFREGIAKNPKLEIIAHNNADWLREKAITVAEEMLQTNDEIDLFFALNDPMAEGAYIAATNAGRQNDMKFIGVDGLPTPDGGIRSVMDGRLSLTMVYPTGGAEAIQSAYKLLVEGEELEKNVTLGTEVVTPENAEEILAKYGG